MANREGEDDALPLDIGLALEEYRTVREEELLAAQSQITTLRYGVTGCVVLIGVAAQQHADRYLGWAVSLVLVPLVVLFSAVIWMGEYERAARAGHYIAGLERRISAALAGGSWRPLRWEGWLREGGNAHSRLVGGHHRYLAIAGVFIGFEIAAVAMGLHFYWHLHSHDPSRHWLVPTAVALNLAVLLTVIGYFRSSYERLRDYTSELERRPAVRQRVRMRVRLYALFGAVGFVSAPLYSWPLGFLIVWCLDQVGSLEHVPHYIVVVPTILWMAIIPLVSSRGLMRELLSTRILHERAIDEAEEARLTERGLLDQLTEWEKERLRVVDSEEINAPSMGRHKHVTVTTAALAGEDTFPGALAHEIGHHRLHHLHPLALSYLYLWPYFYYDQRVARLARKPRHSKIAKLACGIGRGLFTVVAAPGWLAWALLRLGGRTAEYDADRFACLSGRGDALAAALRQQERRRLERRPHGWRALASKGWERVGQGRALGYLPVPNEHPIPRRRLRRVEKLLARHPVEPIPVQGDLPSPAEP